MAGKKKEAAELTAPDPFQETASQYANWFETNVRKLAMGAALLAGAVAVGLFLSGQKMRSAADATAELTKAIDGYDDATDPAKVANATVAGALNADLDRALGPFTTLIQQHQRAEIGMLSRLYAADLLRRRGKHAEAKEQYEAYLASAKPETDFMLYLAREGAGYAAEEEKSYDQALQHFRALADLKDGFYKDYALKHQGRILELKGEREEALKSYKAILDIPESKLRDFAESRIAFLE